MTRHHGFLFLVLLALAAAACAPARTATAVTGEVLLSQRHDFHHGAPIVMAYRAYDAEDETQRCDGDFSPCLVDWAQWKPLGSCKLGNRDMRVTIATPQHRFEACEVSVLEDKSLDVVAFIDLDGDGALSPGEPYGARQGAEHVAPIRIDREMPQR